MTSRKGIRGVGGLESMMRLPSSFFFFSLLLFFFRSEDLVCRDVATHVQVLFRTCSLFDFAHDCFGTLCDVDRIGFCLHAAQHAAIIIISRP